MRFLKMLAALLVLMVLTVNIAAADVTYEPFKAGEITITLPNGLAAQVKNCETAGEIEIDVLSNSEDMDWSALVSNVDSNGEITFGLSWKMPEGAVSNEATTATVTLASPTDWSFESVRDTQWGYADFYDNVKGVGEYAGTSCYAEGWIANYSASTNTFVPRVFDKEQGKDCAYLIAVFFNSANEAYLAKYATLRVTHRDANTRNVKLNYVPKARISTSIDAQVTDGSAVYTLETGHSVEKLVTTVSVPQGAKSFVMRYNGKTTSGAATAQDIELSLEGTGNQDYFKSESASIVWYDGDYDAANNCPTGKVLLAERMDVYVSVGTPKAWLNYITDDGVEKGDVSFKISTSAEGAADDFVKTEYDKESGTVNVSLGGAVPDVDLVQYKLYTEIKAPANATFYAYCSMYDCAGFMGAGMTAWYYDRVDKELANAKKFPVVNGVYVDEQTLFERADFAADQGLTVYYDYNATDADKGAMTVIDWFDDNHIRIKRQWFATTFDSLATVVTQPIITEPMSDEMPQLIAEVPVSDYNLQVTSYPQNSESGTQIHYELKLVDTDGNVVNFSNLSGAGDIRLLIPYPEGASAEDFTFTVNHYNEAGTSVQESVDTASATLKALDEGLLMTVKSLSPFVLSWGDPDSAVSADNLPKTGDSSNLFLYALLCCSSLAGIMLLRRKSRA